MLFVDSVTVLFMSFLSWQTSFTAPIYTFQTAFMFASQTSMQLMATCQGIQCITQPNVIPHIGQGAASRIDFENDCAFFSPVGNADLVREWRFLDRCRKTQTRFFFAPFMKKVQWSNSCKKRLFLSSKSTDVQKEDPVASYRWQLGLKDRIHRCLCHFLNRRMPAAVLHTAKASQSLKNQRLQSECAMKITRGLP
jgi:hypothetical protein